MATTKNRPPVIGIDLDGVVFKYFEALSRMEALRVGLPDSEGKLAKYGPPSDYAMSSWFKNREEFTISHTAAVESGLFALMEAAEGASDNLWKLSDEGYHLRIITSRFVQHGQNQQVISTTATALEKNKIPYRDIVFTEHKWEIFADIYIDDAPSNIERFREEECEFIIFDAPYNQGIEGPRAYNWDDVSALIKKMRPLNKD